MKTVKIPSQGDLHKLLDYDTTTGKLWWRPRHESTFASPAASKTWNKRFAGNEAFTALRDDGYLAGAINYVTYQAHRVIFKYLHGYDPDQVDHDNRNRQDNRPHNLLDASATSNSRNSKLYASNTSGHVGVIWDKARSAWRADITINGRVKSLGRFSDINDAIAARAHAELQHGFHPNHGK